jgi:hypothetical protein
MSQIIIVIETDNDAMQNELAIAKVVRSAAEKIERCEVEPDYASPLYDDNGNQVGRIVAELDDAEEE